MQRVLGRRARSDRDRGGIYRRVQGIRSRPSTAGRTGNAGRAPPSAQTQPPRAGRRWSAPRPRGPRRAAELRYAGGYPAAGGDRVPRQSRRIRRRAVDRGGGLSGDGSTWMTGSILAVAVAARGPHCRGSPLRSATSGLGAVQAASVGQHSGAGKAAWYRWQATGLRRIKPMNQRFSAHRPGCRQAEGTFPATSRGAVPDSAPDRLPTDRDFAVIGVPGAAPAAHRPDHAAPRLERHGLGDAPEACPSDVHRTGRHRARRPIKHLNAAPSVPCACAQRTELPIQPDGSCAHRRTASRADPRPDRARSARAIPATPRPLVSSAMDVLI